MVLSGYYYVSLYPYSTTNMNDKTVNFLLIVDL